MKTNCPHRDRLTPDQIAALSAVEAKATKGEWRVGGYEFDDAGMIRAGGGDCGGHPIAHTATSWQWGNNILD